MGQICTRAQELGQGYGRPALLALIAVRERRAVRVGGLIDLGEGTHLLVRQAALLKDGLLELPTGDPLELVCHLRPHTGTHPFSEHMA